MKNLHLQKKEMENPCGGATAKNHCTTSLPRKSGNEDAYQQLYTLTSKSILYLIRKRVQNDEEAKGLLQETYLQAFRQLHTLKDDKLFITWLHKIANTQYIDYTRGKKNVLLDAICFDDEIDIPTQN